MNLRTQMITLLTVAGLFLGAVAGVSAQDGSTLETVSEEVREQKKKEERQAKAFVLLEQIVGDAQFLKLPENRIRVQIGVADLLWKQDEGRARSLFSLASE